jgi:hypothetical protein
MVAFFEQTWFIWWIFAVLVTLRWLHIASVNGTPDEVDSDHETIESRHLTDRVNSSAF